MGKTEGTWARKEIVGVVIKISARYLAAVPPDHGVRGLPWQSNNRRSTGRAEERCFSSSPPPPRTPFSKVGLLKRLLKKEDQNTSRSLLRSKPVRPQVGSRLSSRERGGLRQLKVEKVEDENSAKLSRRVVGGM